MQNLTKNKIPKLLKYCFRALNVLKWLKKPVGHRHSDVLHTLARFSFRKRYFIKYYDIGGLTSRNHFRLFRRWTYSSNRADNLATLFLDLEINMLV